MKPCATVPGETSSSSRQEQGEGAAGPSGSDSQAFQPLRVGCALLPKKVSRYLTPAMIAAAKAAGIELFLVDRTKTLSEQGPFNAIIHKLRPSKEWECELQEYARAHPSVCIVDSVEGIRTLRNRATMLSVLQQPLVVEQPGAPGRSVRVQAPIQVDVAEDMSPADAQQLVIKSGLQVPLLIKPLWTDGREGSHGLAVVYDFQSLERVLAGGVSSSFTPPVVIQEYVEHGGVLHKVYVLGDTSVVCRRPSLGDQYLGRRHGVLQLPRISCKTVRPDFAGHGGGGACADASAPWGDSCTSPPASSYDVTLDSESEAQLTPGSSRPSSPGGDHATPAVGDGGGHSAAHRDSADSGGGAGAGAGTGTPPTAQPPPEWVTRALANELRARLGMQLFNFDLIVPSEDASTPGDGSEGIFYVVDINYFPGVDKIPQFEQQFVTFLRAVCMPPGSHQ